MAKRAYTHHHYPTATTLAFWLVEDTSRRGGNSHAFWAGQDERPSAVYRTVLGLSYSLVSLGSFTLKDQQVANNVELVAYNSSV